MSVRSTVFSAASPSVSRLGQPLRATTPPPTVRLPYRSAVRCRGASSPARVTTPGRTPFASTAEGRLLLLVRDYASTVLVSLQRRVEGAAALQRRTRLLEDGELVALREAHARNTAFMATIERHLQDAVNHNREMSRPIVHQAYGVWAECNQLNGAIDDILNAVYHLRRQRNPPSRSTTLAPAGSRQHGLPLSFVDIRYQRHQSQPRAVSEFRTPQASLKRTATAIPTQLASVDVSSARDAQVAFEREFGPIEGRRRFLLWLSTLPTDAVERLHSALTGNAEA